MKKILSLLLCFMAVGFGTAFAQEAPKSPWEFGPEIFHFSYEEPGVMEQKGMMYGMFGSYTYRNEKNLMLRAEVRTAAGEVDYENSGTMDNIPDVAFELRGLAGVDMAATEKITITPYTGIGYRYLNDDSSGELTSTGEAGYERESQYLYIPIGVETKMQVSASWSITPIVEYDLFIKGEQESHLSDANLGYRDLTNDQDSGYGVRGSVKFTKMGKTMDIVIEPFIRYWDIDQSDYSSVTYSGVIVGYGYEPANTSTETGLKIAIKY